VGAAGLDGQPSLLPLRFVQPSKHAEQIAKRTLRFGRQSNVAVGAIADVGDQVDPHCVGHLHDRRAQESVGLVSHGVGDLGEQRFGRLRAPASLGEHQAPVELARLRNRLELLAQNS